MSSTSLQEIGQLKNLNSKEQGLESLVLIDMMTGKVYLLKNGLKNLPITDYPLLITGKRAVADIIQTK